MNYLILASCWDIYWEIISLDKIGLKTCNEKKKILSSKLDERGNAKNLILTKQR